MDKVEDKKRTYILISVLIGMLMSAIDTTIVILALPTLTVDLHAPFINTIWVILVYLLVLATLTTQMGKLGDIFGRGRIFNVGFIIFIIGSAMSGASPTIDFLIFSRIIQGFGAVLLQANSNAIIADYFPARERGRAFGITSMGWSIGGVLGIVLGGIITTFIGWRYIFYINVPIGLIGFYIASKYIKDNKKSSTKIDYTGTALIVAMLGLISYGAIEVASVGANYFNLALVIIGLIIIIPFAILEKRSKSPVIDTRVFQNRKLSMSLAAATLQAIGFLSVIFILIMYLQGVRGLTPFYASLVLVPGYLLSSFLSPKMGKLSDRIAPGMLAGTGILLMAAGIVVYLFLGVSTPVYVVIAGSIITGFGGSMFWPSNTSSVMSNSPKQLYGSSSGLLRTLTNIGTLMSYVIAITVAASTVPRYVTFEVFLGVDKLQGGLSSKFIVGLHYALLVSMIVLVMGALMSYMTVARKKKAASVETNSGDK
ncbi:MFS transporter [Ferroplasma acidiphilum]|uniref:MFS transporter n=1 Tax=Ferroplasma acidiphilum TaxID=74969 RepID=UPI0028164CB0|nr:MFS transporter [Ferroplasma acidiphilum]WMT54108.1 MAG: MFS transporter [Ferroplasma acidiphilum]